MNTNNSFSLKSHKLVIDIAKNLVLIATCVGIWILVLQNMGVIPITQNVRVVNTVRTNIDNTVQVEGNVNVDNTVDVSVIDRSNQKIGDITKFFMDYNNRNNK